MLRPTAALLIACLCLAQTPAVPAQQATTQTQPAAPAASEITVPSGTLIPLTLVSPIKKKSTKPGDTVRAQVAFPITIGNQIAIPEGTYVEGILQAPTPKIKTRSKTAQPPVSIHFTRLHYANGYTVNLDAINTAQLNAPLPPSSLAPAEASPIDASLLDDSPIQLAGNIPPPHGPSPDDAFFEPGPQPDPQPDPQTTPTLPPLPHIGPSTGEIVGLIAGPAVLFTVLIIVLTHHRGASRDYVLLSPGYQFQMTLQSPLTLSTASVDAAAATQPK